MKAKKTIICIFCILIPSLLFVLWLQNRYEEKSGDDLSRMEALNAKEKIVSEVADEEVLESLFASGQTVPEKQTLDFSEERQSVVETRSMYQAHAPLRKTGVADADSSQNQEIKKKLLANVLALAEEHQSALGSIPAE